MEVNNADFEAVVRETLSRARLVVHDFDHPLDLDRRVEQNLDSVRSNSHALSIERHPDETVRNRAGQMGRRIALNPAEQRRLNRELVALIADLDERSRRQSAIIDQLTVQVDRLLSLRLGVEHP